MARAARRLLEANVRVSRWSQRRFSLPSDKPLWQSFEREVQERIRALDDGATVVDLGGGRRCVYHHALRAQIELIAVDISSEELALNEHADRTVTADVSRELPLEPDSVDLLVSRAVLEHVADVGAAVTHIARVLKPGGQTLHLLAGRYSLAALAARALPFRPLLWLLHRVSPATVEQVEFDVHYDRCWPSALQRTFRDAGLVNVSTRVSWAQPGYFEPFFPLFLLHSLYSIVLQALNLGRFASYVVVVAERPHISE
jgi:SAM-dependent methyltransferase